MDDLQDTIIPENLGTPKAVVPAKPVKKNKPSLEGINTPSVSNRVTNANTDFLKSESLAGSNGKIVLPSMNAKPRSVRNAVMAVVLLLILSTIGYLAYLQYGAKKPVVNNQPVLTQNNYPSSQNTSLPTATPVPTVLAEIATTTPTITPTPDTRPTLKIKTTSTGFLNVRSLPATSGKQIVQVHPGEIYVYTAKKNGWYQIIISDTQSGWVSGDYVTLQK